MKQIKEALATSPLTKLWRAGAIDGAVKIILYGYEKGYSTAEIAFNLAQAEHETARWLQPIREGCSRHGPAGTDAQATAAIAAAIRKGIIKSNYLARTNGVAHYGRGLIQITWLDNYLKFQKLTGKPLVANPDLALEWETSLFILYQGINKGLFRKHKFSDYVKPGTEPTLTAYANARNIINGDTKKYGAAIGAKALAYYQLLKPLEKELLVAP